MRRIGLPLAVLLVFTFVLAGFTMAATQPGDSLSAAEKMLDSGDYSGAEKMLKRIISDDAENKTAHQLLGDVYKRTGRLDEAIDEYNTALRIGGPNTELYKSLGTVHKWKGDSATAASYYKKALKISPGDSEAKSDLADIRSSTGLELTFMYGGWEPDYTTEAYELMVTYKGINRLNLHAGYGFADQVYYDRKKLYAKAYYFYKPGSYFKVNPQYKDYDYPTSKIPTPDSNSYDKVPSIEFEVQHWFRDDFRVNVAYEFFRPSFFHDPDSHANNHKITTELYYITSLKYLRLKLIYALLRDPDPDKVTIKGRTLNMPLISPGPPPVYAIATSTDVQYQFQSLLGGAVEYSRGRWDAEVKLMPNRDLDSSYSYSILAGIGYDFSDKLTGRFDTVYDKYSSKSNFSGMTANVYLLSAYYELTPEMDLGVGLKYLDLPAGKDTTGFLTISYKTGLGF